MADPTAQRGNILFLILLAVVLFAALSYAVTSSTRGGGNDASGEKAASQASDLFNYFAQLDLAVQRMMTTGGVRDYELNFWYQSNHKFIRGTADNTNCMESRCRVFDPNGGGVSGRFMESFTRTGLNDPERIMYTNIPGTPTSAPDINFTIHAVPFDLCRAINKQNGIDDVLYNVSFPGSSTQTNMYEAAIPVGPIVDQNLTVGVPFSVGNKGTFCFCRYANEAACAATTYDPMIIHTLVAR